MSLTIYLVVLQAFKAGTFLHPQALFLKYTIMFIYYYVKNCSDK